MKIFIAKTFYLLFILTACIVGNAYAQHTSARTNSTRETLVVFEDSLNSSVYVHNANLTTNGWTQVLVNGSSRFMVKESGGTPGTTYVILEGVSDWGRNTYVDDLSVDAWAISAPVCNPPASLVPTVTDATVSLSWTAPAEGTPTGYNIYRNDVLQGTATTTSFEQTDVPDGTYTYCVKAVYPTCESDGFCSEDVTVTVCNPPASLVPTVTDATVSLSWTAPAVGTPTGYNIYRNDELQGIAIATSFEQTDVPDGTYTYCVKAVYSTCESEGVCAQDVTITSPVICDAPQNVEATVEGSHVSLTWDAPTHPFDGGWIEYHDGTYKGGISGGVTTGNTTLACRWTPEDLAEMGGFNLTKVKFYNGISSPASRCWYYVKVWQGGTSATDPGTMVYNGVRETSITSMGWYELPLTTPVAVDTTKELWIGILCTKMATCNPAPLDNGVCVNGKSNLINNNGTWRTLTYLGPTFTQNWLISGLLESADGKKTINLSDFSSTETRENAPISYKIYRNEILQGTATTTSFEQTDVPDGTYTYCVKAVYTTCESGEACSEDVTVTTCNPPASLVPTVTDATVSLSWTAPAEGTPTGYNIYRNDVLQGTATTTSFEQTDVPDGSYTYCVKAVYPTCESEEACSEDVTVTVCNPPTSLVPAVSDATVSLSWTAPAEGTPTGYNIYRNDVLQGTATTTSFEQTDVPDGSYTYCVKAVYPTCESEEACSEDVTVTTIPLVCNAPQNIVSALHKPDNWYNVKLNWDRPSEGKKNRAVEIFNNGSIITNIGTGPNGADLSAYRISTPSQSAWANCKTESYSVADDFTLTQETMLSEIAFYSFQQVTAGVTTPTINHASVVIYDGDPSSDGEIIWGSKSANVLSSVEFSGVYRTTTTTTSDATRPIMRVKASLDVALPAGTYWVEVTTKGSVSTGPFTIPVMTDDNISAPGNAKTYTFSPSAWKTWDSGGQGAALPFILYGNNIDTDVAGYNVYRDNVKLNSELIAGRSYLDLTPGYGQFNYGITAIYDNNCESSQEMHVVNMDQYPCEIPIDEFPYNETFTTTTFPGCWFQEIVTKAISWEIVTKTTGTPATTPDNSDYKLRFTNSVATNEGARTKLIMPMVDITNLMNPAIGFYHTQRATSGRVDTLRLYYKNAIGGEWSLFKEYIGAITDWKEERIALPNPSATYWIAFEGAIGRGSGILLDNITIDVGDVCPPIVSLNATILEQVNVLLNWAQPENDIAPSSYKIYRDGTFLAETTTRTYTDANVASGSHSYCVEVIYQNSCGVSAQSCSTVIITTSGSCNDPNNLTSVLHDPDWYNVQLNWTLPNPMGVTAVVDQSQMITNAGAGYGGANVSATQLTNTSAGQNMTYTTKYAVADDFTLTAATFISDIDFFGYVTNSGTTSPITAANVLIYNGDPSTTGEIIWGEATNNYFKSTEFTGIYRTPGSDLQNTQRPIMKITTSINTLLPAGTYWVQISASAGTGVGVFSNPVTVPNQLSTGNAKHKMPDDMHPLGYSWTDWVDQTTNQPQGIPFVIHGSASFPVGYKVYRDNELLTTNPITDLSYLDAVSGAGSYNYDVTTVWNSGYCESSPASITVNMPITPCATPFAAINESFDATKFPPLCWTVNTNSGQEPYIKRITFSAICRPHSGAGMVSFNNYSYSTGIKGLLITPSFDTEKEYYMLTFWMYRDNENYTPGSGSARDSLNIYLSANGSITGLTPLATFHRSLLYSPVVSTPGWYQYQVALDCSNISTSAQVIFESVGMRGNNTCIDDIQVYSHCSAPTNVVVTTLHNDGCEAHITWNAPIANGTTFNIYRDNVKIASDVAATSFTDSDFTAGQHTWCVATVCGDDESAHVCATGTCTIPTYTITALASVGGTITPTGTISVVYGNDRTFTFTSFTGYQLKEVLVDGTNLPEAVAAGSYTFENVTNNHTIVANFEKIPFIIAATAETGGTITPAGDVTVLYGENQVFTVTANSGYAIHEVLVDGVNVPAAVYSGSYTFINVKVPHTITATFNQAAYTITATAGTGGTVSPSGVTGANHGDNKTFFIVPNAGYAIAQVLVDGSPNSEAMSGVYTFTNISASHTISATFEYSYSTIMATADEGGTIAPAGASQVSYGGSKFYTITPNSGYKIAQVLVNGAPNAAAVETGTYLFTNVTASHSIHATFTYKSYDISASCNEGGTISPEGTITLNYGGSQVYTITTATGYTLTQVLVDGVSIGTPTTYTFSNVIANHSIRAIFEIKKYDITATAGAGGAIFPTGITTVNHGSGKAYSFHANEGYKLKEVLVDGSNNAAAVTSGTYTFSNVTANHTIAANFEAIQFTVTSSIEGANGSITPTGEQKVNYGDEISFTITPNEGYLIDKVLVDGISRPGAVASGEFAFSGVMKDHTIAASFTLKTNINEGDITSLAVYPNPTTGELKIMNGELRMNTILVFDITGKLLMKRNNVDNTQTTIDISEYAQGIYFFNVDGKVVKVVKQ